MSSFPNPTETVKDHFTREFGDFGLFEDWAELSIRDAVSDPLFLMQALRLYTMSPTILRALVEQPHALEHLAEMLDPEVAPATWDSPNAGTDCVFLVMCGPAISCRHNTAEVVDRLDQNEVRFVLAPDVGQAVVNVCAALKGRNLVIHAVLGVPQAACFASLLRGLEADILRQS